MPWVRSSWITSDVDRTVGAGESTEIEIEVPSAGQLTGIAGLTGLDTEQILIRHGTWSRLLVGRPLAAHRISDYGVMFVEGCTVSLKVANHTSAPIEIAAVELELS